MAECQPSACTDEVDIWLKETGHHTTIHFLQRINELIGIISKLAN